MIKRVTTIFAPQKKTMKGYTFLLLILISTVCHAQSGTKLTGLVKDSSNRKPIEYATVTVMNKATKSVVNGGLADSTGAFVVSGIPAGLYTINIESIGYSRKTIDSLAIDGKGSVQLPAILLRASGHTLQGVTVTASGPIIENKIDKIVYNAANDVTSQGGQALDVLKKVPQVNVDVDGNVELQGNPNIRFLINGKPSSVFGNSITDALASIPASQIKSIEVVTSPGAKYDAQGTGGIINIILKDNKMQGVNGSINLSAGTRLENGSANLNFRHNNFGVNVFFSGNAQITSRTPNSQNRTSYDPATGGTTSLEQDGYSDFNRMGYQTGISADWSLTKHDDITAALSYNHFGNTSTGVMNVQQDSASAAPVNSVRNSHSQFEDGSFDWSVNYKKTFKKEGEELNVQYNASYGVPKTNYQQSSTYVGDVMPYIGSASNNPGTNMENDLSVDYSYPVKEHFKIDVGAKTTLEDITSTADVTALQPGTMNYVPDPGQSYNLKYDMKVYAGYIATSFAIGKALNVNAGARYEYTDTKINFPGTVVPAYGTLVPSIILSHDFSSLQFVKLSYTRRIERPDYMDVNPFLNFSDPYNISTGNPTLKPEIGNNMELGYNKSFGKGSNLYVAFIERINTQDHKRVTTYYPSYVVGDSTYNNVSVLQIQNLGTEYNTGMNVSGSWTIKDKLSLRGNVFFMHRHSVGLPPGSNGSDGDRFRMNLNASYQLPKDLIVEAFGNYNSASNNIQGRTPQWITYTFAFRKQFWNKNASVGVTATNVFNKYTRQVTTIQTADYTSYTIRELPYRSVGISLTYKFGKLEFKKGKDDEGYMNNPPMEN
jgi:outer membrane receptor protein involved in Fe transport